MTDKIDEMRGRAKEAAGSLTDNDELKREGKVDRASATAKKKLGNAVDAVKDKVEEVVRHDR